MGMASQRWKSARRRGRRGPRVAAVKLQQSQVWKRAEDYLRIVRVERLEVEYIAVKNLADRKGTRHCVTKKEFCRLLKAAQLMTPEQEQDH